MELFFGIFGLLCLFALTIILFTSSITVLAYGRSGLSMVASGGLLLGGLAALSGLFTLLAKGVLRGL